jgi:hypothetical protein
MGIFGVRKNLEKRTVQRFWKAEKLRVDVVFQAPKSGALHQPKRDKKKHGLRASAAVRLGSGFFIRPGKDRPGKIKPCERKRGYCRRLGWLCSIYAWNRFRRGVLAFLRFPPSLAR